MSAVRVWPSTNGGTVLADPGNYTLSMEFSLSAACPLTGIWFWSPSGATVLPSECKIYKVSDQSVVSGTDNTSPSWSGAAGSGWVKCSYDGSVTLAASTNYKVAVVGGGVSKEWLSTTSSYFNSGPGGSGLTAGPISVPSHDSVTSQNQDTFAIGNAYPTQSADDNYWVDIEVTPTPPTITTTSLPDAEAGKAYSQTLTATGESPFTWSVVDGSLSAGVSLSAAGVFSGTPAKGATTAHFTVEATDALGGTATQALSLNVNLPPGGVTGWDLYSTLQEQAAYAEYYKTQRPVACPHDGTPLLPGPPQHPGVLYCPMGDFQYPDDWDPNTMAGL